MNEPVISPFIIYIIGQVDTLKGMLNFVGGILIFFMIVKMAITFLYTGKHGFSYKGLVLGIILMVVSAFIPNKNTTIAMVAASMTTKANIQQLYKASGKVATDVKTFTIDMIKDIIRAVDEVKNEQKKK